MALDVDDTLAPESIWKKVNFLEKNQNYGIVRTDFARIYDAKPNEIVEYGAQKVYKSLERRPV